MEANEDAIARMKRVVHIIAPLSYEERRLVLMSVLMQEVCCLPPGDRTPAFNKIVADLPVVFEGSQEGMRKALAENAKRGL